MSRFLCCYINQTKQVQIARIPNVPSWYFERVVFPEQQLFFEVPLEALLEIHTSSIVSAILTDRISCSHLQVAGGLSPISSIES